MNDLDKDLASYKPRPSHEVSTAFTHRIVDHITNNEPAHRSSHFKEFFVNIKLHKSAAVLTAIAAVFLIGGSAYATDGFTKLPAFLNAFFAGQSVAPDKSRIVAIDTDDCHVDYYGVSGNKASGDRRHLYRIAEESKVTADELLQMVQGNCEAGDDTPDQNASKNSQYAADFTAKLGKDFYEVTPCNTDPSGYCSVHTDTSSDTADKKSATRTLVESAYSTYLDAYGSDNTSTIQTARETFGNNFAAAGLKSKIVKNPYSYDAVLCAQGTPLSIKYGSPAVSGKTATMILTMNYGESNSKVTVTVDTSSNKISDITCSF